MKRKSSPQVKKTIDLTTSIVGLRVADAASVGLTGTAGTIVRHGTLPIAALGTMELAARPYKKRRRRRKK